MFLFLSYISTVPNIDEIELVTNGTIVPDTATLELLRRCKAKITVLVSDYGASGVDNSKALAAFEENQIRYRVMRDMKWQDRSDVSDKGLTRDELLHIARNCKSWRKEPYFTLNNGIISAHCPTAGSILYYLDIYDECKENYKDIRQIADEDMLTELTQLNEKEYLSMCRYCIPSWDVKYCQAGKQLADRGTPAYDNCI